MALTLTKLSKMKKDGEKVTWITAYDFPLAKCAEDAGVDMILVGDSGGMVQLGYKTTNPVVMDEMITMAKAVRRGAPNTFVVGDMPQGAYEISEEGAVRNALRFVKEAACDAVKLEGGVRVANRIKAIVDAGVVVVGHLGLTPQSASSFGGYRVQGKTVESFEATLCDALALQEAGASAILLEALPEEAAAQIANQLDIPILGIGAGGQVDGQLIIMHDLLGFYDSFRPWFAKCYVPQVIDQYSEHIASIKDLREFGRSTRKDGFLELARMAIAAYVSEVKAEEFPNKDFNYPISDLELEALQRSGRWK